MNIPKWLPEANRLMRWFLACVFLYAGVVKLWRPPDAATLYGQAPAPLQTLLAVVEVVLGAWLLNGLGIRPASLVSIAMLSVFSGLITIELRSPQPRPCGCVLANSVTDAESVRKGLVMSLARNLLLMMAATYVFFAHSQRSFRRCHHSEISAVQSNAS